MSPGDARSSPTSLLRRLLQRADAVVLGLFHIGLGAAALFFLAELAARILVSDPSPKPAVTREESEAYAGFDWRQRFLEDRRQPGGGFAYDPFSEWTHRDKTTSSINVTAGTRATWEPEPDPQKEDISIFTFGGSTMYSVEVPDDFTIASLLAKRLAALDPRRRYVVRNCGVSAFVIDNEVHLLLKLLAAGERPDVVVFYDGLNEIQVKVALGRPHFFNQDYRAVLFRVPLLRHYAAGIVQKLALRSRLVRHLGPSPRERVRRTFPFIEDPERLRENADAMMSNYRGHVQVVRGLAAAFGFRAVFFWQPSLYSTGKVLTEQERRIRAWTDEYLPGLRLANEVTAERMREQGFIERSGLIDARGALDDVVPTAFVDENHVAAAGNTAIVELMAAPVLAASRTGTMQEPPAAE